MTRDAWYCAGWSAELAGGPIGRKLLGRHLVLFRDANGSAHALGARCPHRGADLSQGSVVDGCIQCPFHGWRFDGSGCCVRVPSQPENLKISNLARVPSFPLQERQGTLWIWSGAAEPQSKEPPDGSVESPGRPIRRVFFDAQLVDAPFLSVLENFFDKAHLPFIHTRTFGADQDPLVARQRITLDPNGRSLRAEDDDSAWHVEPKQPKGFVGWVGRLLFGLQRPVAQHMRFDVDAGGQIYIEYPNGTFDLFNAHLTPADADHTWLFVESVRTRAPHTFGDWIQRRAINRIFEEGKRETSLLLGPDDDAPRQVSVESDRLGLAARHLYERWVRGAGAETRDLDVAANL